MTPLRPNPREMHNFFSRKSILVVEDERFSRTIIAQSLTASGFKLVGEAPNVDQALNHLGPQNGLSGGYDAAVVDFELPREHGLFLLQKVRMGMTASPRRLPIVVVTSHADPHLVLPAMALDVSAFIRKPIEQSTLAERLFRSMTKEFEPRPVTSYASVDLISLKPKLPRLFQSTGRPSHLAAQPEEGMELASLAKVTPGSKLARALHDPKGHELVPAQFTLSEQMIDLLNDLTSFEPSYSKIWVEKAAS